MRSALVLMLLVIVCIFPMAGEAAETVLGGLMAWPSAVGQAPEIALSPTPDEEGVRFPATEDTWFGSVTLGNGDDPVFSLAFEDGETPHLWIDANNNESLIDDGTPDPTYHHSFDSYAWIRTLQVSYTWNGTSYEAPYILRITAFRRYDEWSIIFGSWCLHEGLLLMKGMPTTIWLGDMDSDGLFDDLEELLVIVDANGDGVPALDYAIIEQFTPQLPFVDAGQFQLDGVTYAIDQVSPDGRLICTSKAVVQVEPIPNVIVGKPAPAFTVTSLQGEVFSSESLLGRPVILFFTPGEIPDNVSISGDRPSDDRLRDLVEQLEGFDAQILVIATLPESLTSDAVQVDNLDVPLVAYDDELMLTYRPGIDWLIVIGRDGTVLGTDWVTPVYDADGRLFSSDIGRLHVSNVFDLLRMDAE